MRIYCDSNIFRKAKRSSKQFDESVYQAIESLKDSFVFLFSEAHMYDLSKSKESYRIEDLVLMENYVKNNYLNRDHIKKEFQYNLATPQEAYEGIDFDAIDKFFDNPYEYMHSMFDSEIGDEFSDVSNIIKTLYSMPLFNFNIQTNTEFSYPIEYKELLEGLNEVKSIDDALKRLSGMGGLLDSKSEFKKHRKLFSKYINRDDYSFDKWSFEFDEKLKNTFFKKSFSELVDSTLGELNKNNEYTVFINTYTSLESFGVTEERSGKKKDIKDNSYWDIHKDAMHTYYAGKSDYFVTDDVGVQTKAFITYKLLGVETQVLSVKDFVNKTIMLLKNEDDLTSFLKGINFTIRQGFVIDQSIIDNKKLIKLDYPIFNYLDRMQSNDGSIQLFKEYQKTYGIMYAEISLLI